MREVNRIIDTPFLYSPWVPVDLSVPTSPEHVDLTAGSWEAAMPTAAEQNATLRQALELARADADNSRSELAVAQVESAAAVELAAYWEITAESRAAASDLEEAIVNLSNVNARQADADAAEAAGRRAGLLADLERRNPSGRRDPAPTAAQADLSGPRPVRAHPVFEPQPDHQADWGRAMFGSLPTDLSSPPPNVAERQRRLDALNDLYGGAARPAPVEPVADLSEPLADQDLRRPSSKSRAEQVDDLVAKGQTRERAEWLVAARMQFGS